MKSFEIVFFLFLLLFSKCFSMENGLRDGFFFEEEESKEDQARYELLPWTQKPYGEEYTPIPFSSIQEEYPCGLSYTPPYLKPKNKLSPFVNQLIHSGAELFWGTMESKLDPDSCFLADFIAKVETSDEEICAIIDTLMTFGKLNMIKFFNCMTGYSFNVKKTPLNELIKRIPAEDSEIYRSFSVLLGFIEKLPEEFKNVILKKPDSDKLTPRKTASILQKFYICEKIGGSPIHCHGSEPDKTIEVLQLPRTGELAAF